MEVDYPSDIIEFSSQFSTEEACFSYLNRIRWPKGFVCPHCLQNGGWWLEKHLRFECKACHRQTSPLSGTLLHRSHFPLRLWFWAAYFVSTHTPGMSAVQLQRQLSIKKVDNAWYMLHRLRKGMVRQNRELLSGVVETDETHIGGPVKGKSGRGVRNVKNKTLIAGAVEVKTYNDKEGKEQEKAGRLRLAVLENAGQKQIKDFLKTNVAKGSYVKSDGWKGYSSSALSDYKHIKRVQGDGANAGKFAPHIHRAFGNLQTWLNGIHHGVDSKYLPNYLDEFVFRYNRRETPMATFRSLLKIIATSSQPLGLKALRKP